MTSLSEKDAVKAWLENFDETERKSAIDLVDEMLVVSRDDFVSSMTSMLDSVCKNEAGSVCKVALYAERPIRKAWGKIPCFFPQSRHGRAEGAGVPPIVVNARDQEVGSEGIVANLITNYCRSHSSFCFSHPGPNKLRKEKVRLMVVLTDFIGSGQRLCEMLESMMAVATLRSWKSYRLIRFVVIAYSGTSSGLTVVRSHKLRPEVLTVVGCPTIQNSFKGKRRQGVEKLCRSYPKGHPDPLGYKESSALIVFAHGCPNNAPPILHSTRLKWVPLFHKRGTSEFNAAFFQAKDDPSLDQRTTNLIGLRDARKVLGGEKNREWLSVLKVLAAVDSGITTVERISSRTHLEKSVVARTLSLSVDARWLDEEYHLTQLGARELARFRRKRSRAPLVVGDTEKLYYPSQLRTP